MPEFVHKGASRAYVGIKSQNGIRKEMLLYADALTAPTPPLHLWAHRCLQSECVHHQVFR